MAGGAADLWDADAHPTLSARRDVLRPAMDEAERTRLLHGWALALKRVSL
jgi:hypothetical protein